MSYINIFLLGNTVIHIEFVDEIYQETAEIILGANLGTAAHVLIPTGLNERFVILMDEVQGFAVSCAETQ